MVFSDEEIAAVETLKLTTHPEDQTEEIPDSPWPCRAVLFVR